MMNGQLKGGRDGGSEVPKQDNGETNGGGSSAKAWEIDVTQLVLKTKIASGTYGTVYRGSFNEQDVAVKMLDFGEHDTMSRAQFTEIRNSFRQEVAVWSTLNHPSITRFIGASVADAGGFMVPSFLPSKRGELRVGGHVCCVVVEFVPGGTLKDFLIQHRHSKLPLRTVLHLALDLARGLEYLHSKKVVHRDIKSENILLTKQHRAKIADFGVARVEAKNPKDMTGSTGTLGYMAPEVLDGRPYDHMADVYSFGICLWEIYCCDMPFPSLTLREMAAVVSKGLRPVIPGICPRDLAQVMMLCWDGQPSKRPDMGEVVRMLEGVDVKKGHAMTKVKTIPDNHCFCLF